MESIDLINDLSNLTSQLNASIKKLALNGKSLAEAERDYKIKLRQEVLKLRDEKMAVTLIDLIIYGVREVAELRFKRDVAKTIYETNQEHINTVKLQMRLVESQLNREFGNG